jgi:hypothetical protein
MLDRTLGHSVLSDKEAKLLLKGDDELILAVYDYWIDKRLRLKQSLILTVKSDKRDLVLLLPVSVTCKAVLKINICSGAC